MPIKVKNKELEDELNDQSTSFVISDLTPKKPVIEVKKETNETK